MPEIKLNQISKGASGSGGGTVDPPEGGVSTIIAGFSSEHISIPTSLMVDIYNAGFTDGSAPGDVPGPVEMYLGANLITIEVGQRLRFEAVLDPVNNVFNYIPEIEINDSLSSSSMIEYSYQTL